MMLSNGNPFLVSPILYVSNLELKLNNYIQDINIEG